MNGGLPFGLQTQLDVPFMSPFRRCDELDRIPLWRYRADVDGSIRLVSAFGGSGKELFRTGPLGERQTIHRIATGDRASTVVYLSTILSSNDNA